LFFAFDNYNNAASASHRTWGKANVKADVAVSKQHKKEAKARLKLRLSSLLQIKRSQGFACEFQNFC
jgi:hypothetical protein